jgi:hypothetical protein
MFQGFKYFLTAMLVCSPALAFDWSQPILDENGKTVPDCLDPVTGKPFADPVTGKPLPCDKIITIGSMAVRALLNPQAGSPETPEQKALAGNLAIQLMTHPEQVPAPDDKLNQMKIIRDAIGRMPSPLAVARGWAIIDNAVK